MLSMYLISIVFVCQHLWHNIPGMAEKRHNKLEIAIDGFFYGDGDNSQYFSLQFKEDEVNKQIYGDYY